MKRLIEFIKFTKATSHAFVQAYVGRLSGAGESFEFI